MGGVIDPPPLVSRGSSCFWFCFKQRTGSACSHGVAVVRTGQRVPSRESQSRALGSAFSHGSRSRALGAATVTESRSRSTARQPTHTE